MKRAISIAQRAAGRTSPNPLVGCVIVKNGRVIAEGWHRRCGADHAEVEALKKAGERACGATMYATLEPCSHWGRTPPCVDAVLKAGIKKVVVAMIDPNPVNNGKSLTILRKHGVSVVLGICEDVARAINRPFIKHMTEKMPFVVAKIAQSLDGKTSMPSGQPRWITAPKTRLWAKKKRDLFDAIMVGVNTVIEDDPRLDAPSKSLKKVIVDSTLLGKINQLLCA
ncbi:MAG: bifunctional diaminohydroxyphosphoribosylaminopyrimidine deaminase/5-amino-6-(5-phosphoribosylamino)uracil reductase RibD, partial [Candidatus Omnitrophica bacterium]|nr:bifunctional diaminohydroxyphosphoribosylaminopyrimidine deaminase/5-amino-6-(5-phosphoribosylamino)uracil reductase RibD [Candidatus Omnitrophota bacterium]